MCSYLQNNKEILLLFTLLISTWFVIHSFGRVGDRGSAELVG